MILPVVGVLLVALGLFAGAVLLAAPLGLAAPDLALWVLFPLFCLSGYALFVAGVRTPHARAMSMAVSTLLLLLALAAAAGLVLAAAAIVPAPEGTISLWYVLAIAGVLGAIGTASHGPRE